MNAITKSVRKISDYFREVVVEVGKSRWPSRKDMVNYTIAVIIICVVMFLLTYAFDLLVTEGFKLIGIGG
nr:preprotein translocase subunit SecE [Bacilli bacterium]